MISLTSPVRTRAHSWPAGLKLIGLCAVTVALFYWDDLGVQVMGFTCALLLYALPGGLFLRTGVRRLALLWPFLAVIAMWHLLTDTAIDGAIIALRLITAVAFANLVTMTTRLSDMIDVVTYVATPLRLIGVHTRAIELAIALVIRFTPVLIQKGQGLSDAWHARSGRRLGWRIIIPFAVLAIDDADHVAEALKARGGIRSVEER